MVSPEFKTGILVEPNEPEKDNSAKNEGVKLESRV
jgi:hypothetical protein